jgi:alpha-L-rhamnosidase
MNLNRRSLIQLGGVGCGAMAISAQAAIRADQVSVINPRVCGLEAPLDLGRRQPRFSWVLADPGTARQTAYRPIVARSQAGLASSRELVRNSGRVASAATFDILYGGPPAPPRTRLWWRVEVWTSLGDASVTCSPSSWETGLVGPDGWTADWLASETRTAKLDREAGTVGLPRAA